MNGLKTLIYNFNEWKVGNWKRVKRDDSEFEISVKD
jgi:hypothetical protein